VCLVIVHCSLQLVVMFVSIIRICFARAILVSLQYTFCLSVSQLCHIRPTVGRWPLACTNFLFKLALIRNCEPHGLLDSLHPVPHGCKNSVQGCPNVQTSKAQTNCKVVQLPNSRDRSTRQIQSELSVPVDQLRGHFAVHSALNINCRGPSSKEKEI
jgi:hypothetical protein